MTVIIDLDTPALLVDLPRLRRNIAAMQTLATSGVCAAPAHQDAQIADDREMQVEAGARASPSPKWARPR